jgi:hypothetical protein
MRNLDSIKNAIWSTIVVGNSAFITVKLSHITISNERFWLYLLIFTFIISYIINNIRNVPEEPAGTLVIVDNDERSDIGLSLHITVDELKKRNTVEFTVRHTDMSSQHKP